ncbi:Protein of unknown function, partial [Gryllus bimaculatus]
SLISKNSTGTSYSFLRKPIAIGRVEIASHCPRSSSQDGICATDWPGRLGKRWTSEHCPSGRVRLQRWDNPHRRSGRRQRLQGKRWRLQPTLSPCGSTRSRESACGKNRYFRHVDITQIAFRTTQRGADFSSGLLAVKTNANNVVISPLSAAVLLALTRHGAAGATEQQIASALQLTEGPQPEVTVRSWTCCRYSGLTSLQVLSQNLLFKIAFMMADH